LTIAGADLAETGPRGIAKIASFIILDKGSAGSRFV
jgi:hypothetical protein